MKEAGLSVREIARRLGFGLGLRALAASMPKRMKLVIEAEGWMTKY